MSIRGKIQAPTVVRVVSVTPIKEDMMPRSSAFTERG